MLLESVMPVFPYTYANFASANFLNDAQAELISNIIV